MVRYNWDDPPVGLATILKALAGDGSGVGGLSADDVQALINGALSGLPTELSTQDVQSLIDVSIAAIPPSTGGGGMNFKGAYAGGAFELGDVVTDLGKLLVCTTAYDAVGGPASYVGATSALASTTAPWNVPLPAGCEAGDLVIYSQPAYPAGVIFAGADVFSLTPNSDGHLQLSSYQLTADDITAGVSPLCPQTPITSGAVLTVYRNATVDVSGGNAGWTTPVVTPTGTGFLHTVCETETNGAPVSATLAALSSITEFLNTSWQVHAGYETCTEDVPTTSRVWSSNSPLQNIGGCAVAAIIGGGVDLTKWAVLSAS